MRTLATATPEPTANLFTEVCSRCRGKGVRYFGRPVVVTPCRACGGSGERTFKQPAEKRAKINEQAKTRKATKLAESIAAFKAEYPHVWRWMDTSSFPFAGKMKDALLKYGALTEKQLAASIKCVRVSFVGTR